MHNAFLKVIMFDTNYSEQLKLLLQLLDSRLQLLSSKRVGDVRCDARRRFFASSQILLGARDGQVGGAPPGLRQTVTSSYSSHLP